MILIMHDPIGCVCGGGPGGANKCHQMLHREDRGLANVSRPHLEIQNYNSRTKLFLELTFRVYY